MNKRLLGFFVIIVTLLSITVLTSCNILTKPSNKSKPFNNEPTSIRIIDMENREHILNTPPERIVAIGSALRLYTYMNSTNDLVGVERGQQSPETGRPYIIANPELLDLPIVGEGFPADPDPELLISLAPDVIIAGDIFDLERIEQLQRQINIPIIVVTCGSSAVFDKEMYQSLEIIGQIIGKEDRADNLIAYMEDCKNELYELTKDIPNDKRPSIYVGGLSHKGTHGIESTSGNSPVLNVIGANNVADDTGKTDSIMIDKEQLIKWDPDILIIDENGLSIVMDDYKKNHDFYKSLSAVKNKNVYGQLPYVSYYNNIETAMADIYYLGKILYPEEFKDIDPIKKADEIYTFILDMPLYNIMTDKYGGFKQISLE